MREDMVTLLSQFLSHTSDHSARMVGSEKVRLEHPETTDWKHWLVRVFFPVVHVNSDVLPTKVYWRTMKGV